MKLRTKRGLNYKNLNSSGAKTFRNRHVIVGKFQQIKQKEKIVKFPKFREISEEIGRKKQAADLVTKIRIQDLLKRASKSVSKVNSLFYYVSAHFFNLINSQRKRQLNDLI